MFDMEMLNDALNMPLPLFSTGKEEEDSALAPSIGFPFAATTHSERGPRSGPPRYCSSNVYLSKRKKPPFERNGANSPSSSSSTLLDRLPVRIDSGVMRCRTSNATPPAIIYDYSALPIFFHRGF